MACFLETEKAILKHQAESARKAFQAALPDKRDYTLRKCTADESGSTANVVIIESDFVYVANLGDSRSVLCRSLNSPLNGEEEKKDLAANLFIAIDLSHDHKVTDQVELNRIQKYGGNVIGSYCEYRERG